MKRILALCFALLAACTAAACAAPDAAPDGQAADYPPAETPVAPEAPVTPGDPISEPDIAPQDEAPDTVPDAPAALTGRVVQAAETWLLLAGEENGELYTVPLRCPVYDADGNRTEAAVQSGQLIEAGFGGTVMETYPAKIGEAAYLRILSEPDDRVGLYLAALAELWDKDTALNENLTYLAFDLSHADNLTEGEKDALVYLASNAYGAEPLTGTFDELCEDGYIDRDALDFADGLLIELSVTEQSEDAFTFDLTKWRGGLASYTLYGCTATRENGAWTYETGAEMIS